VCKWRVKQAYLVVSMGMLVTGTAHTAILKVILNIQKRKLKLAPQTCVAFVLVKRGVCRKVKGNVAV
jgi:hypothetical protein